MSCEQWREQVALYAGGDLEPSDTAQVERHLETCAECAQLSAELIADREMLTADFAEPDYAGIRRNVRTAIVRKRIVRSAAAITVLAAAALIAVFMRPPQPATPQIARVDAPPPIVATVEPIPEPVPVRHASIRRAPAVRSADEPRVAMYIATRNPKVTILLLQARQEISNE
jgi:anti-sigma factor RsiW